MCLLPEKTRYAPDLVRLLCLFLLGLPDLSLVRSVRLRAVCPSTLALRALGLQSEAALACGILRNVSALFLFFLLLLRVRRSAGVKGGEDKGGVGVR